MVAALVAWSCIVSCATADDPLARVPPDHPQRAKEGLKLFREQVGPLLREHCLDCHGGKSTKGDFDLGDRKSLMESGYVEPSAPDSYLVELIEHRAEPHMPFKKPKLADKDITLIRKWIDLGAPYDKPLVAGREGEAPAESLAMQVTDDDRQFWSFQPLADVAPPAVKNEAWCRTPIDRFILAKQEEAGLTPNDPASRRVLIRRATFDLLGLPPTPEEVEAFVNDPDPEAWPKLIDRLLDSDHYGERWARHWMDVARFAESTGYEQDDDRPHAWHYRDFLIQAFNADMPFDQFLRWQLAGDELAPDDKLALMATGFLGAGPFPSQLTETEFESSRYDELDDMIGTMGVAFLGLSVGCARCHDHKFDPIPTADYYRLASIFATTIRSEVQLDEQPEENARRKATFDAKQQELTAALAEFERMQVPGRFDQWLASYDPAAPPESLTKPAATKDGKKDDPKARQAVLDALSLLKKATSAEPAPETKDTVPSSPSGKGAGGEGLLQKVDDKSLRAARTTATQWFQTTLPEWQSHKAALDKHVAAGPGLVLTTLQVNSEGLPKVTHRAEPRGFPYFYPEVFLLKRGDVHQKQEVAQPGYLQVLMPQGASPEDWRQSPPADWTRTSYRRASLAHWMTDVERGAGQLAARVIVNRLWQHHFGTGLVATPNDFGFPGERPTHPELLDWLARDLIDHGWQLKRLHKLMLTSSVYMQSGDLRASKPQSLDPQSRDREGATPSTSASPAKSSPAADPRLKLDPDNRLLWRRPPQRLEAEAIRDAMLSVSGLLDPTMHGPGTLDEATTRRSVYFTIKRSQLIPTMMLFDWPEHLVSIGSRSTTTIAPQALMFLNSPQGRRYADAFAARLKGLDDRAAVTRGYSLALSRAPSDEELRIAAGFLQSQAAQYREQGQEDPSRLALVDLCQALFGMNEFVYVE
jgi:mono/diheme cytochrome c family protein